MNRYPAPPQSSQGQPLSSVGGYPPPGMVAHMPSPQTVPPYNVAVASPSQYVQQSGPGPSPTQGHYAHPSVMKLFSFSYLDSFLFHNLVLYLFKIDLSFVLLLRTDKVYYQTIFFFLYSLNNR